MSSEIQNLWKTYLYTLQLQAPKPKSILCDNKISNKPPFYGHEYHGKLSRENANKLLDQNGEGSYLVRESERFPGTYTLCLRYGGINRHYKLYFDGLKHYVRPDKRVRSLKHLVADGLITMHVEAKAGPYLKRELAMRHKNQSFNQRPYMSPVPDLESFNTNMMEIEDPGITSVTLHYQNLNKEATLAKDHIELVKGAKEAIPPLKPLKPAILHPGHATILKPDLVKTTLHQQPIMSCVKTDNNDNDKVQPIYANFEILIKYQENVSDKATIVPMDKNPGSVVMRKKDKPQDSTFKCGQNEVYNRSPQTSGQKYNKPNIHSWQSKLYENPIYGLNTHSELLNVPIKAPQSCQSAHLAEMMTTDISDMEKTQSIVLSDTPNSLKNGHTVVVNSLRSLNLESPILPNRKTKSQSAILCSVLPNSLPLPFGRRDKASLPPDLPNSEGIRRSFLHPSIQQIRNRNIIYPTSPKTAVGLSTNIKTSLHPCNSLSYQNKGLELVTNLSKSSSRSLPPSMNVLPNCPIINASTNVRSSINFFEKSAASKLNASGLLAKASEDSFCQGVNVNSLDKNNLNVFISDRVPSCSISNTNANTSRQPSYDKTGECTHNSSCGDVRLKWTYNKLLHSTYGENESYIIPRLQHNFSDNEPFTTINNTQNLFDDEMVTMDSSIYLTDPLIFESGNQEDLRPSETNEINGPDISSNIVERDLDTTCLNIVEEDIMNGRRRKHSKSSTSSFSDISIDEVSDTENRVRKHSFKVRTFKTLKWCDICGDFMWGLINQGVKCKECGICAHSRCSKLLTKCDSDFHVIPPTLNGKCNRTTSRYLKNRIFGVDLTTHLRSMRRRLNEFNNSYNSNNTNNGKVGDLDLALNSTDLSSSNTTTTAPISEVLTNNNSLHKFSSKIPLVLQICCRLIEKYGIDSEGIYRIPGYAEDVENFKKLFDTGEIYKSLDMYRDAINTNNDNNDNIDNNKTEYDDDQTNIRDINVCASVLKLYLRMLPIPLITYESYDKFLRAIEFEDTTKIVEALRESLQELPHSHYNTLKYLMTHLNKISKHQSTNLMGPTNLATIFSPNILKNPMDPNFSGPVSYDSSRHANSYGGMVMLNTPPVPLKPSQSNMNHVPLPPPPQNLTLSMQNYYTMLKLECRVIEMLIVHVDHIFP